MLSSTEVISTLNPISLCVPLSYVWVWLAVDRYIAYIVQGNVIMSLLLYW